MLVYDHSSLWIGDCDLEAAATQALLSLGDKDDIRCKAAGCWCVSFSPVMLINDLFIDIRHCRWR